MTPEEKTQTIKEIKQTHKSIDNDIKEIKKIFKHLHKKVKLQALLIDGLRKSEPKTYTYTLSNELEIPSEQVIVNQSNYVYTSKQAGIDAESLRRFNILVRKKNNG